MPPVAAVTFLSAPSATSPAAASVADDGFRAALAATAPVDLATTTPTGIAPAGIAATMLPAHTGSARVANVPTPAGATPSVPAVPAPPEVTPAPGATTTAPPAGIAAPPVTDGAMSPPAGSAQPKPAEAAPRRDPATPAVSHDPDLDPAAAPEPPAPDTASPQPGPPLAPGKTAPRIAAADPALAEEDPSRAQISGEAPPVAVDPAVTVPPSGTPSGTPAAVPPHSPATQPDTQAEAAAPPTSGIANAATTSAPHPGTDRTQAGTTPPDARFAPVETVATSVPDPIGDKGDAAAPPAVPLPAPAVQTRAAPATPAIAAGTARAATIGRDVGLAIARHVDRDGANVLTIRLDPVELGRVEVRLQIDSAGKLLATIAADQPAALELLRRDTAMLAQTLSHAGVQADAGSFSFDTRSGDGGRGGAFAAPARAPAPAPGGTGEDAAPIPPLAARAMLRTSGRINLVA